MNLHGIVSGAIGAVNPLVQITVQISTGYAIDANHRQAPTYGPPVRVMAQIQPLNGGDLRQVESLNLQGDFEAVYINGQVEGLVRPANKGGDKIIFPDGSVRLVTMVTENWPDWCRVVTTLQDGA